MRIASVTRPRRWLYSVDLPAPLAPVTKRSGGSNPIAEDALQRPQMSIRVVGSTMASDDGSPHAGQTRKWTRCMACSEALRRRDGDDFTNDMLAGLLTGNR